MTAQPDRSGAAQFQDEDVVGSYVYRPDYPAILYARLLGLMPGRRTVLDLGCGPGKIARALARHVKEVLAVDPSPAMLALGEALSMPAPTRTSAGSSPPPRTLHSPLRSISPSLAPRSTGWIPPRSSLG